MKDPVAIGLFGFAVPLFILAGMFIGWLPMTGLGMELYIAVVFGAVCMYVGGWLSFEIGNGYVATVFFSYGSFFGALGFAGLNGALAGAMKDAPSVLAAWYDLMALISLIFLVGALRLNVFLVLTFAALTAAFVVLALGMASLAGMLFMLAALLGFYLGAVHVINPILGPVLPVFSLAVKKPA